MVVSLLERVLGEGGHDQIRISSTEEDKKKEMGESVNCV